ncbi:hypothetical protein GCM10010961_21530 [Pseudodonghicola xiamenensis]|uniref:Uncharacterized protein n=1 Tax=Pseudodonghicola xiamenensis TaxID=337702 RepID=A0A8J3MCC1_9RHOB|nr:hypothetical protein GCM10010961_21530 [Pseudodonghicola xiamenensis]
MARNPARNPAWARPWGGEIGAGLFGAQQERPCDQGQIGDQEGQGRAVGASLGCPVRGFARRSMRAPISRLPIRGSSGGWTGSDGGTGKGRGMALESRGESRGAGAGALSG